MSDENKLRQNTFLRNGFRFSLLFIFCSFHLNVLAQSSQGKVSLLQALQIMRESFNIHLAYDGKAIEGVEVEIPPLENLEESLNELLAGTDLDYQIMKENQVLIREKQIVSNKTQKFTKELLRIKGRVVDAQSGEALPYALVLAGQNAAGTETDNNGEFVLLLKEKEEALLIQYLGYDNHQVIIDSSKEEILIHLNPNPISLGDVLVEENVSPIRQHIDRNHISYTSNLNAVSSGMGPDFYRNLGLIAGVNIQDDLVSELSIRGGNRDENMILFDGIPLYKSDHYFGLFSNVNENVIQNTTIYKNAFPVKYGGRTAGIIEMETREPSKSSNGGLDLNLLSSNAYANLDLSDQVSLLLGARMSNTNLASDELFEFFEENTLTPNRLKSNRQEGERSSNPSFEFQDVNAKITWKLSKKGELKTALFYSNDALDYNYVNKFENRNQTARFDESYSELQFWKNKGLNLQYQHILNDKWTMDASFTISSSQQDQDVQSVLERTKIDMPSQVNSISFSNKMLNQMKGSHFKINQTKKVKHNILNIGYEYTVDKTIFNIDVEEESITKINAEGVQHSLFASYENKYFDRLRLRFGLRNTYYDLDDKSYLSPRLDLNLKLGQGFNLKAAASKYYQFTQQVNYEDRLGRSIDVWLVNASKIIPIASSEHAMLGFRWLNKYFDLDVEFYHKDTYGFIQYSSRKAGFETSGGPNNNRDYFFFLGNKINRGLDIILKRSFKNYNGWIAYSLGESKHVIPNLNQGNSFPGPLDQRHQFKFINQFEWDDFEISGSFIFSSGKPYLDLGLFVDAGPIDREDFDVSDYFTYLIDYKRVDLSAAYKFEINKIGGSIGFSIFNLLDTENIKYRQFIYTVQDSLQIGGSDNSNTLLGNESKLIGRTYNLRFKLDF